VAWKGFVFFNTINFGAKIHVFRLALANGHQILPQNIIIIIVGFPSVITKETCSAFAWKFSGEISLNLIWIWDFDSSKLPEDYVLIDKILSVIMLFFPIHH